MKTSFFFRIKFISLVTALVANGLSTKATVPNKLTILHTNDIHSHYDETNLFGTDCTNQQKSKHQCYGGLARMKHVINQYRSSNPNTLLLDGGDQFQGTMFYQYYKGNATIELMNEMGYDLMTLGNHEFDDGPENLSKVIEQFQFPVICANLEILEEERLGEVIKPYVYLEKYDLAVIGYISEGTGRLTSAGPNIKFKDPIEEVQKVIDELKARGINRIIALSHNGYKEDQLLARNTRGLSLIVGGHSHSYLAAVGNNNGGGDERDLEGLYSLGPYPTKVINQDEKPTYIVQAYCWARLLGHLEIEFGTDGYLQTITGQPIELTYTTPKDPIVNSLIQSLRQPFDLLTNQTIGYAQEDFSKGSCYSGECAMGDLLSDSMFESITTLGESPDFAIMNSGGIRATLSQGDITVREVLTILPFANKVVTMKMLGKDVKNMVLSVLAKSNIHNQLPVTSFIQISNMQIHYASIPPSKPILQSIFLFNSTISQYLPLDLDRFYKVVTCDFIANGGDNFMTYPKLEYKEYLTQDKALMEYIKNNTPLKPKIEGRIVRINGNKDFDTSKLNLGRNRADIDLPDTTTRKIFKAEPSFSNRLRQMSFSLLKGKW